MLAVEQTVTVSHDHRFFLDLPPEFPVGKAKVELVFTPLVNVSQKAGKEKIRLARGNAGVTVTTS